MYTKHFLSLYYGIDESLPDDLFYAEIEKINKMAEIAIEKFTKNIYTSGGQMEV